MPGNKNQAEGIKSPIISKISPMAGNENRMSRNKNQ
jgi:hypothetical protein